MAGRGSATTSGTTASGAGVSSTTTCGAARAVETRQITKTYGSKSIKFVNKEKLFKIIAINNSSFCHSSHVLLFF